METLYLIFFIGISVMLIVCTIMSVLSYITLKDPRSYTITTDDGLAETLYENFSKRMLNDPALVTVVKKMVAQ